MTSRSEPADDPPGPAADPLPAGLLLQALDGLPHAAWIVDTGGRLLWANAAFALANGLGLDEAVPQPLAALLPPVQAGREAEQTRAVLAAGESVSFALAQVVDGVASEQSVQRWPLRDASGAVVAVAGVCTDVTRESLARRQQHELCARVRRLQDQVTRLVG